jgi:hypothetical protein
MVTSISRFLLLKSYNIITVQILKLSLHTKLSTITRKRNIKPTFKFNLDRGIVVPKEVKKKLKTLKNLKKPLKTPKN